MSGLHFANPQWVHLLWLVLVIVAVIFLLERRAGAALSKFVALPMQKRLVQRVSVTRRTLRLLFLAMAGLFLTLALMRPQWGLHFIATPRMGAEIMVCLDVSKSMLAEDVSPNRLQRAKAELRDLLTYLKGDQIGLIAFAGRASVLSPLTPDFGFLRLALQQAGTSSVRRGGTRLEEPIRKAIAGFGSTGDVSRSILLITDGEDQDSFPLEAAKDAAKRGIRILAIGFGDEAGSEITLTDQQTGVRSILRDRDGTVVKSRLDGEMLRQMTLLTDGAYIPAGTGVLDLESIYDRHIASLTRGKLDGRGRSVRNDAFQWVVLLGLLCLVAAVASTATPGHKNRQLFGGWIVVLMMLVAANPLMAEENKPTSKIQESHATAKAEEPGGSVAASTDGSAKDGSAKDGSNGLITTPSQAETKKPADPRLTFNQGLQQFEGGEWDEAQRLWEVARSSAGNDGEVRFRATYNLGWVEVKQADGLLEKEPQQALQALHRSASWFREAIGLRPKHEEARHNLEIVLNRALVLADSLASQDKKDLLEQLNQTIQAQRAFLDGLRPGLDLVEKSSETSVSKRLRHFFRELSAQQLAVLGDGEKLSKQAGQELEHIRGKEEKERTAEEGVRASQLDHMLHFLHRARERMGQTRSRMRHQRAEQAFRRASAALTELKRAREQLLDPKTRLDALLADGMELAQFTAAKAQLERGVSALEPEKTPVWLTVEYLEESQKAIKERSNELHQGVAAGLERAGQQGEDKEPPSAELLKLMQQLQEAEPFMGQAVESFVVAEMMLEGKRVADAIKPQGEALTKLAEARERFLDLKGLIELVWQDENRITSFLKVEETVENSANAGKLSASEPSASVIEYLPTVMELQDANVSRGERVGGMITEQLQQAQQVSEQKKSAQSQEEGAIAQGADQEDSKEEAVSPESDEHAENAEVAKQQLQRLQLAKDLQARMIRQMKTAHLDMNGFLQQSLSSDSVEEPANSAEETTDSSVDLGVKPSLDQLQGRVAEVTKTIEALRQLFFSVVEHLKETLRRQMELNDTTKEVVTLAESRTPEETANEAGPLLPRQQGLAQISGSIATAMDKQVEMLSKQAQPASSTGQSEQEVQAAQAQQQAQMEKLRTAAQHVTMAETSMKAAVGKLEQSPPELSTINEDQDQAVKALQQALMLLQPPKQQQQSKGTDQAEQEQQEQAQKSEQPEVEPNADPSQLLQGVRDREAKRREEQGRSRQGSYEPVERDW